MLIELIGLFIILFMLGLSLWDFLSFRKGEHYRDLKGTIMTTGVFGTFTGIAVGLFNFDTANVQTSLPQLLEGLKIAFGTSIVGMFLALALTVIQKAGPSAHTEESLLLGHISRDMEKLVASAKKTHAHLLEEGVRADNRLELIGSHIDKAAEESRKVTRDETIKILSDIAIDFNKYLTDQLGENFREFNAALGDMRNWHSSYLESLNTIKEQQQVANESLALAESTITKLKSMQSDIDDKSNSITEAFYDIRQCAQGIKEFSLELGNDLESIRQRENSYKKFSEFLISETNRLGGATRNIATSITAVNEELGTLPTLIRLSTEKTVQAAAESSISEIDRELTKRQNDYIKRVTEATSSILNTLESTNTAIKKQQREALTSSTSALGKYNENINSNFEHLEESFRKFSQRISRELEKAAKQ